jgi:hypothetical protein
MHILLVPARYHSKKFLKKFNMSISKTKCPTPKQKVPPLSRGVITLGNVPSQYTGKCLPGFYGPVHVLFVLDKQQQRHGHHGWKFSLHFN